MNFCVAILMLKMEENTQHFWHIMLYYLKKDKNTTETHKKDSCSVWKGAVTDRMCQKWFVKLPAGDFLISDAPQSHTAVEVDSENRDIENNQHYTTVEIADIFKLSKSIKLLVKMKNTSFILWKKLNGLFGQPSMLVGVSNIHYLKTFVLIWWFGKNKRQEKN